MTSRTVEQWMALPRQERLKFCTEDYLLKTNMIEQTGSLAVWYYLASPEALENKRQFVLFMTNVFAFFKWMEQEQLEEALKQDIQEWIDQGGGTE